MLEKSIAGLFLVGCLILLLGKSWAQTELTANEILRKVDDIRSPDFDYRLVVSVTSYKPNRPIHTSTYELFIKGRENTVVRTLEPKREHGICLLMHGQDFMAFFPQVSKPIHLSLQERMTGDVANGDIARTCFSYDYNANIVRHEKIDGKEYEELELTPKNKNATYGRILLWVAFDNFWPLKAEFYAVSGRFLTVCFYKDYKALAGEMRPSRLVIKDGVINDQCSVMDYKEIQRMDIPDSFFTKENLMQLKRK